MDHSILNTIVWIGAIVCLVLYLARRRKRKMMQ
jgi:LPXTG-motif cell wall-anchored protein